MTVAKPESGAWASPWKAKQIAAGALQFQELFLDGNDIYWVEMRPAEGGRYVVMKAGDKPQELTPPDFSARTLVNSYGGGSALVRNGTVYFSNYVITGKGEPPFNEFHDQRIFRQAPGQAPVALTSKPNAAYADGVIDPKTDNWLVCVREDQTVKLHGQPQATLVAIDLATGEEQVLVQGNDFYAFPRFSPDGTRLCWVTWNYPNMPWDGTELWVGRFENGTVSDSRKVAGGPQESIFQPQFAPDGVLCFISDRTGWWNIYRWDGLKAEPVCPQPNDFGAPLWYLGSAQYDFAGPNRIICSFVENGQWVLADISLVTGALRRLKIGDVRLTDISHVHATAEFAVFIGGAPDRPAAVYRLNLTTGELKALQYAMDPDEIRKLHDYISIPEVINFPTGGETARAFFYPPTNPKHTSYPLPAVIVKNHGGPTGAASTALDPEIQYFTSRGFAVVDVNYRGSTGYGRQYRQEIYEQWGVYDKDDCIACVDYLAEQRRIDRNWVFGRGGSAGGYTTLCLLTFAGDLLKAGASYYGVADLDMIRKNSDKLEAHYPELLIGAYPQYKQRYHDRSPCHFAKQVQGGAIFLQGEEDPVVPKEQTERMVKVLKDNGKIVAVKYYPNEQHHFRMAEHIEDALLSELYFYSAILGFEMDDSWVQIYNLPKPVPALAHR